MRQNQLLLRFQEEFGYSQGVRFFFAPGRVNLIGEHTDYNGGYVFPAALTLGTWAAAAPRTDGKIRLRSTQFTLKVDLDQRDIQYRKEDDWANYPKGMLSALLQAFPSLAGTLKGVDLLFHGNIPNGAGLSSSASILLVSALAFTRLAQTEIPMLELVKLAQKAENEFLGVNCGIMDQFAIGMGKSGHAIKLKCDTLQYEYFPIRMDGYRLVITNSNKRRGLADSKYNERRRECEEGLRFIQRVKPDVQTLGDLDYDDWSRLRSSIADPVIRNRVEHVVSENERVILATKCLEKKDLPEFGEWMKKSHESLRDLYEVTGKELDILFEAACQVPGCIGSRMTGAGFGGCGISLVAEGEVEDFKETVTRIYAEKTSLTPTFYVCEIGDGAREVKGEEIAWPFW
ncbi:galactokinase [Thermoactinomyces daqus]|uniref:Galactokinase n=1 Tax=Thermoactinomyces daqus TaxID=1329516 RepID=A0A7W2AIM7_9BACL|nr:galactokinase [Thermoactinomyces daqus]MBA4544422.1 galactokinase [Thermoactinomyces daqus]